MPIIPVKMKAHTTLSTIVCFGLTSLLSLHFMGCSPAVHTKEEPAIRTVYMGDPMKMIEGAALNPKIDFSFFEGAESVSHFYTFAFVDKQSYNRKAKLKVSAGQETPLNDNRTSPIPYEVSWSANTDGSPQVSLRQKHRMYTLYKDPSTGKNYLHFQDDSTKTAAVVEILHFSVSVDKQHCSLLFVENVPHVGQVVSAFYYSKKMKNDFLEKLNLFKYVRGVGLKIAWPKDKPIEIQACGANTEDIKKFMEDGVQEWNAALDSLQSIELKQADTYYPFSDLNQHCIYYVDSFILEPNENKGLLGITISLDFGASQFTDSDIFILKGEFLKNPILRNTQKTNKLYSRTIAHELGHFLGLHHQFDGTKSIMSYDFKDDGKISDYDKDAIRALYK